MKQPLIVLAGPTAVGKTELSLSLAERLGAEIIGADSMQVYRGMDIGTAKLPEPQRRGIPHHLIDVADPTEPFDVVRYQQLALEAVDDICARGRVPMLVGGTGFYIQSVTRRIDFNDTASDEAYRRELEEEAEHAAPESLHDRLRRIDPEAADAIPAGNVRRVIRALEFHHATGEKISVHNERERQKDSPFSLAFLVLSMDRASLYERIDRRVDRMMEEGFLEEVRCLRAGGVTREMTSMQALGYQELMAHLDGECRLEEAVEQIKTNSRHYAKRQVTWFKREKEAVWLAKDGRTEEELLEEALRAAAPALV